MAIALSGGELCFLRSRRPLILRSNAHVCLSVKEISRRRLVASVSDCDHSQANIVPLYAAAVGPDVGSEQEKLHSNFIFLFL